MIIKNILFLKKFKNFRFFLFIINLISISFAQPFKTFFQYDNLNRLIQIKYPNGTIIEYTYDPVGNRLSHNITVEARILTDSETVNSLGKYSFNEVSEDGDGHEVEVTFNEISGSGVVSVEQTNQKPDNVYSDNCLNYSWDITADSEIISFNTNITFHYLDSDVKDIDEANLVPAYYDDAQSEWIMLNDFSNDLSNNTITVNNLNHFTKFALGTKDAFTPPFMEINKSITGVSNGKVLWGDYDNDGDLDLAIVGYTGSEYVTKIYRNDQQNFIDIGFQQSEINAHFIDWGDFDNDGDLDFILTGDDPTDPSKGKTLIYENKGESFVKASIDLTQSHGEKAYWTDLDNDGDLDIIIMEKSRSDYSVNIYLNNNGKNFTSVKSNLPDYSNNGNLSIGDFDKDGDMDLAICGLLNSTGELRARIYSNFHSSFTDIQQIFQGVQNSCIAWGDYDSDGFLDIVLSGNETVPGASPVTKLYRNNCNQTFSEIPISFPNTFNGSLSWGDYNNNGRLDLFISGICDTGYVSQLFENKGRDIFQFVKFKFTPLSLSSVAWGDYDNDGDLDLAICGDSKKGAITKIYQNNSINKNLAPSIPENLISTITDSCVILKWSKSNDDHTFQYALSYNIRLGSSPGKIDLCSPMADTTSGSRRIVQLGNAQQDTFYVFYNLPNGRFYWSVQAIDQSFAASKFSNEKYFDVVTGFAKTNKLPLKFALHQSYPNPFNPIATIRFDIPRKSHVFIEIFNLLGQKVTTLVNEDKLPGYYKIKWNGKNSQGIRVSSGLYFYKIRTKYYTNTKKMILLR